MKILLAVLSLCLGLSFGYYLSCPDVSQWSTRARLLCPDPSKYYCLWDGNAKVFMENCSKVDLTRAGERLVIQYNFDSKFCPKGVYQPYIHLTNESSGCIYKKSTCNEEGQVVYDDTDTKKDTKCSCDNTRGYVFVTRPRNPCYCIPSEEDCSCYLNPCRMSALEFDYRCTNTTKYQNNCLPLRNESKEETRQLNKHTEETTSTLSERGYLYVYAALIVTGLLIPIIGLFVIIVLFEFKDNEEIKAENLENIQNTTETRFYIRVIIVGENGVGKTSLLRRLLGEGIQGVESTDGIDIRRCKIRLSDGKWIVDKDTDPIRKYAERIRQANKLTKIDNKPIPKAKDTADTKSYPDQYGNTSHENAEITIQIEGIPITEPERDPPLPQQSHHLASAQKANVTPAPRQPHSDQPFGGSIPNKKITKDLNDKIAKALDGFLLEIEKYDKENEAYVEIGFWDFAGQKDFYGTHHTFLNSDALFLLVTDCSKAIKITEPGQSYDSIGGYINFWVDTIHNCMDVQDENADGSLDLPIIVVCTGTDKLTEKDTYLTQYCQDLNDVIKDGQKVGTRFVSNKESTEKVFDGIRGLIYDNGKNLKSFGKKLPLKSIRLEQLLDVLREGGVNIITRSEVIDHATKCGMNDIEVEEFLKNQHAIGSIIYYENIKDYVILSQQWLADAFRCLVSHKIDDNIRSDVRWGKLLKTGILEKSLITELFKKDTKHGFSNHQEHILEVMEKFDIIGINKEQKEVYYMPYMITSKNSPPLSDIFERFGVLNEQCKQTPWLCFEFDFFPLAFFTYVMLYFIKNYEMCEDTKLNKESIYHGVGVFFLDDTHNHRFIVIFCKNAITFQIWNWEEFTKYRYPTILNEFQKVIDNLKMRYEARNLRYKVKVKCSKSDANRKKGRVSYTDLLESKDGKYECDAHTYKHELSQLLDTWFYNYSNDKEMNSNTDTHRDTESFDSVRCQLCVSDPRPAVYWCNECLKAMCRECTTVHRTQPTSSTHTTVLLTRDYNFQIKGINIKDIASLCEGVLIISESKGKQLISCDIKGHNKQLIPLPYSPYKLSVIDQNNVAVTAYDGNKVLIVDVTQKNITKQFDIKKCWGIMYRDNHLYVGCNKSLVKVDMSGEIIRTVPLSFTPWYIRSGTEGRIYCTDISSNTVYCIDTEGNTVFTVTNPDMSDPVSITFDNEGHVLVACDGSNNVHRISPDGKQCNVIIKNIPSNNFRFPSIYYDSISKSIVISLEDTVYVYKI